MTSDGILIIVKSIFIFFACFILAYGCGQMVQAEDNSCGPQAIQIDRFKHLRKTVIKIDTAIKRAKLEKSKKIILIKR